MIDYKKELNIDQYKVVMEQEGPLLVIAGAGSGKTRTLTYRVARLIESGIDPGSILLATFTNKAALAMLNRVKELVNVDLDNIWGGTFHHICHRILRAHASLAGLKPNFSILDSEDARQLMNTCVSLANLDGKGEKFPRANVLLDIFSLALKTETSIEETLTAKFPFFYERLADIVRIAEIYENRKVLLNVVDFEDLLIKCRRVLREAPGVATHYARRFQHILVDEYQDTDKIQADVVDMLATEHRNLMVVGDDSQSIYSFRGASLENILQFPRRYPDCRIYKLETNYRSTPEILNLANNCIINNEKQYDKKLRPIRAGGIMPIFVVAKDVLQQANFVAQRLLELLRSGVPSSEIAILYRAHYHSMELQMELTRRGIPFVIRSGIRFFEQAHVKDLAAFLKIIAHPHDELAWKRILGMYEKVGPKTADKVWRCLERQPSPLEFSLTNEFVLSGSKGAVAGLKRCQATLMGILDDIDNKTVSQMIDIIIKRGYRDLVQERYSDYASREEDLRQLANFSLKFLTLREFLSELALMSNIEAEDEVREERLMLNQEKIILSTIHQAKGLEWSVVFLIWCAEGMLPLARALKEPGGEEEERRLFYVAVTRAKDQLYLAYPRMNHGRPYGYMVNAPSMFIRELSGSYYKKQDCPYEKWVLYNDYDDE